MSNETSATSFTTRFACRRLAALRLAEQNTYEMTRLKDLTKDQGWLDKKLSRGGTSQNGDWSQFRNARFRGEDITLGSEFFASRLGDKTSGNLEFDFVSTERIAGGSRAMNTEEFRLFYAALDLYVSPTDKNENIERLAGAVKHIQKSADGFNAKAPQKPKVIKPPTPTEMAKTRRRGAQLQSAGLVAKGKMDKIEAKVKNDLDTDAKAKKDFFRVPSPKNVQKGSAANTPKAGLKSRSKSGDSLSKFDAKETFLSGISQVRSGEERTA